MKIPRLYYIETENTRKMYKRKELCLESLKGIGACVVAFAWHYQHFSPSSSPFYNLIPVSYNYGWLMVELFFMLSGFGMMIGYKDKIQNHQISFEEYFIKRLFRLYPLFFITLLIVTFLQFFYIARIGEPFTYPNFDVYHFILNLLCIQDGIVGTEWSFNAPSWCISICLFCYIIFYYCVYISKRESEIYYKLVILALIGSSALILNVNYPLFNTLMGRGVLCFSIGAILAGIYEKKNKFNTTMIGHLFLIILVCIYAVLRLGKIEIIGNLQMTFILGIAPLIIMCVLFVPWLKQILEKKPFTLLGSLSIHIYLFHFPVQCFIRILDEYCNLNLNYASKIVWLLYIILVLLVSIISKKISEMTHKRFTI